MIRISHALCSAEWLLAIGLLMGGGCQPVPSETLPPASGKSPVDPHHSGSSGSGLERAQKTSNQHASHSQARPGRFRFVERIPTSERPASPVISVPVQDTAQIPSARLESADERDLNGPRYRNGEDAGHRAILETVGGGVAVVDFDRDGRLDLVLPQGGEISPDRTITALPTRCLRGQSEPRPTVTWAESPPLPARGYSHGVAAGDFDGDGFPDLLMTGLNGPQLWINQGDGTWIDATKSSGLDQDTQWCTAAAWGDFNGDGRLDLYLARYVNWSWQNHPDCRTSRGEKEICPPRRFEPMPHSLYLATEAGRLSEQSHRCGMIAAGKGLGVLASDLDLDGDTDLYVANDSTPNLLYWNDGQARFQERGTLSGVALSDQGMPDGSMGVAAGDYDGDGLPDLWVANYERELFGMYHNLGQQTFVHVSQSLGMAALGGTYVGFGTLFGDWDSDGDLDIVVSNGHVELSPVNSPLRQHPLLLENSAGKRYENVSATSGDYFTQPHRGRGVAQGDLDRDGDLDLVFSPVNEPATWLENQSPTTGRTLALRLVGCAANRDAIGATARLETTRSGSTARTLVRQINGGESYLSQSDLTLTWAIPDDEVISRIELRWPGGRVQELGPLPVNSRWIVREGTSPVREGGE